MPSFTYIGTEERYYPEAAVLAAPGVTATFDSKPDDNWAGASSAKAAEVKQNTPDPTPAPAVDTPKA